MITTIRNYFLAWSPPKISYQRYKRLEAECLTCSNSDHKSSAVVEGHRLLRNATKCQDVYELKPFFLRCKRLEILSVVATIVLVSTSVFCLHLWPMVGVAMVCVLGSSLARHIKAKHILNRPIIRASKQADDEGPSLRNRLITKNQLASGAEISVKKPGMGLENCLVLGGLHQRGFALLHRSNNGWSSALNNMGDSPDLISSSIHHSDREMSQHMTSVLRGQIMQSTRFLKSLNDPLQVRAAIKKSIDITWFYDCEKKMSGDEHMTPEMQAISGLLFRGSRAYALNAGNHRVVLCHARGMKRLTVDHGQFDPTERAKRIPWCTPLMQEKGLSRAFEASSHPNASKQSLQVSSITLDESKGGAFVSYNNALSVVLSDSVIHQYVTQELSKNTDAQDIATALIQVAAIRYRELGQDLKVIDPIIMVVRSPDAYSFNTQAIRPDEPPIDWYQGIE